MRSKAIFYGDCSRFLIREVDGAFAIHDASCVSDAELREGKRSPEVHRATTLGLAKRWCDHAT